MTGAAGSVYRGARATLTQHPGGDYMFLTIAVKDVRGRWDEWSLLMPALRVPSDVVDQHLGAAEALESALHYALTGTDIT